MPLHKLSPERAKALGVILVVEDDADTRELLAQMLWKDGYRVRSARDGAEALETLTREPDSVAVLLLDLAMPGLGGREFLQRRVGDPRLLRIPVILISGEKDANDTAVAHGLDGSIGKPINLPSLRHALATVATKMTAQPT